MRKIRLKVLRPKTSKKNLLFGSFLVFLVVFCLVVTWALACNAWDPHILGRSCLISRTSQPSPTQASDQMAGATTSHRRTKPYRRSDRHIGGLLVLFVWLIVISLLGCLFVGFQKILQSNRNQNYEWILNWRSHLGHNPIDLLISTQQS